VGIEWEKSIRAEAGWASKNEWRRRKLFGRLLVLNCDPHYFSFSLGAEAGRVARGDFAGAGFGCAARRSEAIIFEVAALLIWQLRS